MNAIRDGPQAVAATWQWSISSPSRASRSRLGEMAGSSQPVHPSESKLMSSAVMNRMFGRRGAPEPVGWVVAVVLQPVATEARINAAMHVSKKFRRCILTILSKLRTQSAPCAVECGRDAARARLNLRPHLRNPHRRLGGDAYAAGVDGAHVAEELRRGDRVAAGVLARVGAVGELRRGADDVRLLAVPVQLALHLRGDDRGDAGELYPRRVRVRVFAGAGARPGLRAAAEHDDAAGAG